jgi:BirA family biotin operon repressor/biotin-[acetyl-CoA-carboxylase] ligase
MAEGAETAAGLAAGVVRLKWPNDLVVESADGVRKLAGVLGESDGIGSRDPRAVIGVGVNGDWAPRDFPPELAATMTSLRELTGRAIDHVALLEAFLGRLEVAVEGLRAGRFGADGWSARQVTTGRGIELIGPDGVGTEHRAIGVDPETGALIIEGPAGGRRSVVVGEIRHVRLADPAAV